jgi:hypothetical protein
LHLSLGRKSQGELLRLWRIILLLWLSAANAAGYSVLTHEELIDLAWTSSIRPLLLAKFPGASEEQLREAHAYAYGGSAIQDMGYYPFGKKFFSNLTHYVRTGDFIATLFRNARTIDEYAFAIGALSHYLGDSIGHSQAINPATALGFPKLERKYGRSVTYGESPHGHIRTEFAFDICELSDKSLAPRSYQEFIGFQVPRKFLEKAFAETYGFDIHEVLGRAHPALRSYRISARSFIPAFAGAEVVLHRHQFPAPPDDEAYRRFAARVAQTNYDRKWKGARRGPGLRSHLLAALVWVLPKIGPISDLAIKIPTTQTEDDYLRSVNHTVDQFDDALHQLQSATDDPMLFANLNLDTGNRIENGKYALADQAHAQLLARLTSRPERIVPPDLKRQLIAYFEDGPGDDLPKSISDQLAVLQGMRSKGSN